MDKDQDCCKAQEPLSPRLESTLKRFKDCSIEEKIERLHMEVKGMKHTIFFLLRENDELKLKLAMLDFHTHSLNGDVVVKLVDKNMQNQLRGGGIACTSVDILA